MAKVGRKLTNTEGKSTVLGKLRQGCVVLTVLISNKMLRPKAKKGGSSKGKAACISTVAANLTQNDQ